MPATARPLRAAPGSATGPAKPRLALVAPRPPRRVVSLRIIVPLASVLMLAVAMLAGAFFWEDQTRTLLAREAGTRFVAETRQLAMGSAGALLEPFPELTLQPIVREMLSGRREILDAEVVDLHGTLVASASPERLGKPYHYPPGLRPVDAPVRLRPDEQLLEDSRSMIVVSPVIHSSGQRLGTAILTVRRDHLERALSEARRRVWGLLVIVLPLGGVATLLLIRRMLLPLASLRAGLERIGQGHLDTRIELRGHTEIGVLAETVNHMAGRLSSARREALERERLQGEIDVAGRIQRLLLPTGGVEMGRFRIAGNQVPAAQVGGDYFDVFPLAGNRLGLAVADVSGKGVGGCLVMAMLSSLLRAFRETVASPSELLVLLERHYPSTLRREHFVTFWYAILDPESGRLTFASAGHLPALVYRAADRSIEWRKGRGVPLGALRGDALKRSLSDEEIDLHPGDLLVQFTDGFSEATDGDSGEEFGFERIGQAVRDAAALGPEGVLARLREAVRHWSGTEAPEDDQTMVVVGCLAGPARAQTSEAEGR